MAPLGGPVWANRFVVETLDDVVYVAVDMQYAVGNERDGRMRPGDSAHFGVELFQIQPMGGLGPRDQVDAFIGQAAVLCDRDAVRQIGKASRRERVWRYG